MNGRDARSTVRGPAILLYRGTSFVDRLIQWQTRSPYSHAAILTEGGTILESANGIGVRERDANDEDRSADAFVVQGAGPFVWGRAEFFCRSEIGSKYDWIGIARFITRKPGGDPERWFCSELVSAAFEFATLPLLERIEHWAVSPGLIGISPIVLPYRIPRLSTTETRRHGAE